MKPIYDLNPKNLGLIRRPDAPKAPDATTITAHAEVSTPPPPPVPYWLREATRIIRTKFSAPADGRGEWDIADTQAYGKLFAEAGETLTPKLIATLRERHVWRPSVAEVRAALDELRPPKPVVVIEGRDAAARKVVKRPLALPSTGENAARTALREKMRALKGTLK